MQRYYALFLIIYFHLSLGRTWSTQTSMPSRFLPGLFGFGPILWGVDEGEERTVPRFCSLVKKKRILPIAVLCLICDQCGRWVWVVESLGRPNAGHSILPLSAVQKTASLRSSAGDKTSKMGKGNRVLWRFRFIAQHTPN